MVFWALLFKGRLSPTQSYILFRVPLLSSLFREHPIMKLWEKRVILKFLLKLQIRNQDSHWLWVILTQLWTTRSKVNSWSCSLIVRLRVGLRRSVVRDSNWRLGNLSWSYHQWGILFKSNLQIYGLHLVLNATMDNRLRTAKNSCND